MGYLSVLGTRPTDLNPEAFSTVGGGMASQTVFSQWDLYKPHQLLDIFERHSHNMSYRLFIAAMGWKKGTATPTVGHYEAPWKKDNITIGSIVTAAGGVGNEMIVALASTDMYDPEITSGGSARKASYPIVGDELYFPTFEKARIMAKNVTTDPHRLTLAPVKATIDLDDVVNESDVPFISDNSHGEGSGLPAGRSPRLVEYSNTFQIIKTYSGATGSELSNQAYVNPIEGVPGSFYLRVKEDMFFYHEDSMSGALIYGQQKTGLLYENPKLGYQVPITGTEGLIDFSLQNSAEDTYTPGSLAVDDFNDVARYFEDERIGKRDLMHQEGLEHFIEVEDVLVDFFNTDMGYFLTRDALGYVETDDGMPLQNKSDWAGNVGFRAFRKAGYTNWFKSMHEFNDVKGGGGAGFNLRYWSIIMPIGYTTDKKTGKYTPILGYEWKELNGYSREFVVGSFAGVGVAGTVRGYTSSDIPAMQPSGEYDVLECGIVSEIAAHFACSNQILLQKPA